MHIEVDQSGKIEQLNKDTCIAFSNNEEYCIKLPKQIKQKIVYEYRPKVSQIIQRIFAICVFHCLEDYLNRKELIIIDTEYSGWEADIKTYLIPLLKSKDKNFDKLKIEFRSIGKDSRAHKVAKSAFVGKSKPNKILTKEDITKWLRK